MLCNPSHPIELSSGHPAGSSTSSTGTQGSIPRKQPHLSTDSSSVLPKGTWGFAGHWGRGAATPAECRAHGTCTGKRDTHYREQRDKHHSPGQAKVSGKGEVGKKGGLVGCRRRGKINQEQSRLTRQLKRGLLRTRGSQHPPLLPLSFASKGQATASTGQDPRALQGISIPAGSVWGEGWEQNQGNLSVPGALKHN